MSDFPPKITLAAVRINANMTQKEAAKQLNISISTLRNYEEYRTTPDRNMAKRMEELYKFPFDYVL